MARSSDEASSSSLSAAVHMTSLESDFHIAGLSYLADSDSASEDFPSETSDDRAFIASDTERSTYFSSSSSTSEASFTDICPSCSAGNTGVDAPRDTIKLPISSITRRIVVEHGHEVEQRLILWASWE